MQYISDNRMHGVESEFARETYGASRYMETSSKRALDSRERPRCSMRPVTNFQHHAPMHRDDPNEEIKNYSVA